MTAPPTNRPMFAPEYQHPQLVSSAASAPDAAYYTMAPAHCNAHRSSRKSSSPTAQKKKKKNNGGVIFITTDNPAGFKDRFVMTKVRKQAMAHHLDTGKKRKTRSRKQSEDTNESADYSPSSAGSDQQDPIDVFMSQKDTPGSNRGASTEGMQVGRRTQSPASSAPYRRTATPDSQILRYLPALDVVLSSAPLVQPKRVGISFAYMDFIPRPFQSLGKPFDPFRSMFQSQNSCVSVEELKFHCHEYFGTKAMGMYWIPTLVKSPHAFLSTLCIASAHHDSVHGRATESVHTIALRQEVIHLVHQNILNPHTAIDDFNIIALTQLIVSELIAGEDMYLEYHQSGVEKMVNLRGGLQKLGVNGRLASTLSWVSLQSAILRETKPNSMYADYCAFKSTKNYPNTATVPESPLFVPRGEYQTVERSQRCLPRTLSLLKDIRMMLDLFLHETRFTRQNLPSLKALHKKITTDYPSASDLLQAGNILTQSDWMYEAIRVASVIQATAIINRIPLSEAVIIAAQSENNGTIYSSTHKSDSNESLVSTEQSLTPFRHDSPLTSFSASPSYATRMSIQCAPSQQSYFAQAPTSRPSISTTSSTSTFSSTSSTTYSPSFTFSAPPYNPKPISPTLTLLTNLRTAIENADLSDCWSDMAGVLLWVGLIAGAASHKLATSTDSSSSSKHKSFLEEKILKKWFAALTIRCSIVLCFEHPEGIHASLGRMGEVIEGLNQRSSEGGKRRRI